MVRDSVLVHIKQVLGSHLRFEEFDFNILNSSDRGRSEVQINYLGKPQYFIVFEILQDSSASIFGKMSPGNIKDVENFSVEGIEAVYEKIIDWQSEIWAEFELDPVIRMQNEQQKILDEILGKFDTFSKEYFSAEEGEELKSRLDEMEKNYRDIIENLISDTKEREERIQNLENDIETLKATVTAVNAGFWRRSMASKMVKWVINKENQDGVKGLIDLGSQVITGQKLLGE